MTKIINDIRSLLSKSNTDDKSANFKYIPELTFLAEMAEDDTPLFV